MVNPQQLELLSSGITTLEHVATNVLLRCIVDQWAWTEAFDISLFVLTCALSTHRLRYERACSAVSDPILFGKAQAQPHTLAEDVLVQSRPDNLPDAIGHVAYLLGTRPGRSEILDPMYAQSRSLLFGRELVSPGVFLISLDSLLFSAEKSRRLFALYHASRCITQWVFSGETDLSKAWTSMLYLKNCMVYCCSE